MQRNRSRQRTHNDKNTNGQKETKESTQKNSKNGQNGQKSAILIPKRRNSTVRQTSIIPQHDQNGQNGQNGQKGQNCQNGTGQNGLMSNNNGQSMTRRPSISSTTIPISPSSTIINSHSQKTSSSSLNSLNPLNISTTSARRKREKIQTTRKQSPITTITTMPSQEKTTISPSSSFSSVSFGSNIPTIEITPTSSPYLYNMIMSSLTSTPIPLNPSLNPSSLNSSLNPSSLNPSLNSLHHNHNINHHHHHSNSSLNPSNMQNSSNHMTHLNSMTIPVLSSVITTSSRQSIRQFSTHNSNQNSQNNEQRDQNDQKNDEKNNGENNVEEKKIKKKNNDNNNDDNDDNEQRNDDFESNLSRLYQDDKAFDAILNKVLDQGNISIGQDYLHGHRDGAGQLHNDQWNGHNNQGQNDNGDGNIQNNDLSSSQQTHGHKNIHNQRVFAQNELNSANLTLDQEVEAITRGLPVQETVENNKKDQKDEKNQKNLNQNQNLNRKNNQTIITPTPTTTENDDYHSSSVRIKLRTANNNTTSTDDAEIETFQSLSSRKNSKFGGQTKKQKNSKDKRKISSSDDDDHFPDFGKLDPNYIDQPLHKTGNRVKGGGNIDAQLDTNGGSNNGGGGDEEFVSLEQLSETRKRLKNSPLIQEKAELIPLESNNIKSEELPGYIPIHLDPLHIDQKKNTENDIKKSKFSSKLTSNLFGKLASLDALTMEVDKLDGNNVKNNSGSSGSSGTVKDGINKQQLQQHLQEQSQQQQQQQHSQEQSQQQQQQSSFSKAYSNNPTHLSSIEMKKHLIEESLRQNKKKNGSTIGGNNDESNDENNGQSLKSPIIFVKKIFEKIDKKIDTAELKALNYDDDSIKKTQDYIKNQEEFDKNINQQKKDNDKFKKLQEQHIKNQVEKNKKNNKNYENEKNEKNLTLLNLQKKKKNENGIDDDGNDDNVNNNTFGTKTSRFIKKIMPSRLSPLSNIPQKKGKYLANEAEEFGGSVSRSLGAAVFFSTIAMITGKLCLWQIDRRIWKIALLASREDAIFQDPLALEDLTTLVSDILENYNMYSKHHLISPPIDFGSWLGEGGIGDDENYIETNNAAEKKFQNSHFSFPSSANPSDPHHLHLSPSQVDTYINQMTHLISSRGLLRPDDKLPDDVLDTPSVKGHLQLKLNEFFESFLKFENNIFSKNNPLHSFHPGNNNNNNNDLLADSSSLPPSIIPDDINTSNNSEIIKNKLKKENIQLSIKDVLGDDGGIYRAFRNHTYNLNGIIDDVNNPLSVPIEELLENIGVNDVISSIHDFKIKSQFHNVTFDGRYDYSNEMLVGPTVPPLDHTGFKNVELQKGYYIITPCHLYEPIQINLPVHDSDGIHKINLKVIFHSVLVNRGWVPQHLLPTYLNSPLTEHELYSNEDLFILERRIKQKHDLINENLISDIPFPQYLPQTFEFWDKEQIIKANNVLSQINTNVVGGGSDGMNGWIGNDMGESKLNTSTSTTSLTSTTSPLNKVISTSPSSHHHPHPLGSSSQRIQIDDVLNSEDLSSHNHDSDTTTPPTLKINNSHNHDSNAATTTALTDTATFPEVSPLTDTTLADPTTSTIDTTTVTEKAISPHQKVSHKPISLLDEQPASHHQSQQPADDHHDQSQQQQLDKPHEQSQQGSWTWGSLIWGSEAAPTSTPIVDTPAQPKPKITPYSIEYDADNDHDNSTTAYTASTKAHLISQHQQHQQSSQIDFFNQKPQQHPQQPSTTTAPTLSLDGNSNDLGNINLDNLIPNNLNHIHQQQRVKQFQNKENIQHFINANTQWVDETTSRLIYHQHGSMSKTKLDRIGLEMNDVFKIDQNTVPLSDKFHDEMKDKMRNILIEQQNKKEQEEILINNQKNLKNNQNITNINQYGEITSSSPTTTASLSQPTLNKPSPHYGQTRSQPSHSHSHSQIGGSSNTRTDILSHFDPTEPFSLINSRNEPLTTPLLPVRGILNYGATFDLYSTKDQTAKISIRGLENKTAYTFLTAPKFALEMGLSPATLHLPIADSLDDIPTTADTTAGMVMAADNEIINTLHDTKILNNLNPITNHQNISINGYTRPSQTISILSRDQFSSAPEQAALSLHLPIPVVDCQDPFPFRKNVVPLQDTSVIFSSSTGSSSSSLTPTHHFDTVRLDLKRKGVDDYMLFKTMPETHLGYAVTWGSFSAIGTYMTYLQLTRPVVKHWFQTKWDNFTTANIKARGNSNSTGGGQGGGSGGDQQNKM